MNDEIILKEVNGEVRVSSREMAERFEKQNKHVNEAIRKLMDENSTVRNMVTESKYLSPRGREETEYLLNRDGFSLVAMGFTGKKALEWKLKYIEAFNKMEEVIKKNQLITNNLSPELQVLINLELQQKQLATAITENKQEIQDMRNVISLDTTSWRKDTASLISKIALKIGGFEHIKDIREESYKLLNDRMGVSLSTRLTNKRRRMADEGVSKSRRDKLNCLDIIAEDKKLIEGYVAIIKEMAIKYGVA